MPQHPVPSDPREPGPPPPQMDPDRCAILDALYVAVDERQSDRYPMRQSRPFGTGPHTPFRGASAAGLAEHYRLSVEASEQIGKASWRAVLSADFYAAVSTQSGTPERLLDRLIDLAASCMAAAEDIQSRIPPTNDGSDSRGGSTP